MTIFVVDKTIQIQRHKQVRSVQAREDPPDHTQESSPGNKDNQGMKSLVLVLLQLESAPWIRCTSRLRNC